MKHDVRHALRVVSAGVALTAIACSTAPSGATGGEGSSSATGSSIGNGGGGIVPEDLRLDGGVAPTGPAPNPNDTAPRQCERVVEFTDVALAEPPPFDVVIVADHSDSLAWSRQDLAAGLETLLTNVRGQDVRFFVLTPTQYGASTEAAAPFLPDPPKISWKDSATGTPHPQAVTEYSVSCTDGEGAAMTCPTDLDGVGALTAEGKWSFVLPDPIAAITGGMSDAEIQAQQDAVSRAILDLPTGGASLEQPLCTLNRYVRQEPSTLPSNVAFLVISDEDDTSDSRQCLVSHTTTREPSTRIVECTEDCSELRFSTSRPVTLRYIDFDCVPEDDLGNLSPELAEPDSAAIFDVPECTPRDAGTCTADDLEIVGSRCAPGFVPLNCAERCMENTSNCALALPNDGTDACTQAFDYEGTTYANLAEYCDERFGTHAWEDCTSRGQMVVDGGSPRTFHRLTSIVDGGPTQDLSDSFMRQADAAFTEDGYVVEAIVFDPRFSCTPQTGQSHGASLAQLATSDEHVFPICEPYDDALGGLKRFGALLLQSEYALTLEDDEVVENVVVTDQAGAERNLAPGDFSYDPDAQSLSLDPEALTPADVTLEVELVAECRAIVR